VRGLPRCSCVQRHPHHIWSVFWRAVPLGAEQLHQLGARGRAVQVDPIKPTLKALGTKRLKQKYVELLSNFAFNFNLRRYIAVMNRANMAGPAARQPPSMAADSAFSGVSNIENIAPTPAYNQRPGAAANNNNNGGGGGGGGGGGPMRPSDFNKPQMVKLPVINSVTPGQRPGLMVGPAIHCPPRHPVHCELGSSVTLCSGICRYMRAWLTLPAVSSTRLLDPRFLR